MYRARTSHVPRVVRGAPPRPPEDIRTRSFSVSASKLRPYNLPVWNGCALRVGVVLNYGNSPLVLPCVDHRTLHLFPGENLKSPALLSSIYTYNTRLSHRPHLTV